MSSSPDTVIVIFGASGDLAARKLLPALFQLSLSSTVPYDFAVLGVGRSKLTTNVFRDKAMTSILNARQDGTSGPTDKDALTRFVQSLYYQVLDTQSPEAYAAIPNHLTQIVQHTKGANLLFYLATPPFLYTKIAESLAAYDLAKQDSNQGWRRLVIEKPFGNDLASAKELNSKLLHCFDEDQIFRIDHYLGKETVQNILVTRLANGLFEPIWNRKHIHHVEITCAETIGVEDRGGYYDDVGALRDMVQNHMLQLLGFLALEPPESLDSETVRSETLKTFLTIEPPKDIEIQKNYIRGQYTTGIQNGREIEGYLQESKVRQNSNTETYVAAKLFLDNERWRGVPFFLRTGKRLAAKVSEVVIHFKPSCGSVIDKRVSFSKITNRVVCDSCNQLVLRIAPDEGVLLRFGMKLPGTEFKAQSVDMIFRYASLGDIRVRSAYERLLLDCLVGDTMLFPRGESIVRCWEIIDPVRAYWEAEKGQNLFEYQAGSWGPHEAEMLIDNQDMMWRYPNSLLEGNIN